MPKVSVIVPVYNVEPYISKCLDSLADQTLKDFEAIIVNDGSTDNSQKIIDDYTKAYPNIFKPFTKKNGGQSDARNYGLDRATGDYIYFLDSDDYIDETTLEKMYNKAIEKDFCIVASDFEHVYDDSNQNKYISADVPHDLYTIDEIKSLMINIYGVTTNKVYKKALFESERFKKGVWYEDIEILYRLLPHAKTIGIIKEDLYKYYQRQSGNIMSIYNAHVYDYVDNMNGLVEYYKNNDLYDEFYPELEYVYVRYILATFIKTAAQFEKDEYKKAVNIAIENVRKTFPNYKKNKYLRGSRKGFYLKHFNKFLAQLVYTVKKKRNKG